MTPPRRPAVKAAAACAVAGLWCACAIPASILIGGTSCPLYGLIGLPCPLCGTTRAFAALLHGDIPTALRMHPLIFLIALDLCALLLYAALRPWRKALAVFLAVSAVLILGVYICRMIALFPHTFPMVYNTRSAVGRVFGLFHPETA